MGNGFLSKFLKATGKNEERREDEFEQTLNQIDLRRSDEFEVYDPKRAAIESQILHEIRIDNGQYLQALHDKLGSTRKDPLFLCSAIYRGAASCVDFYLNKGADVHASAAGYKKKDVEGDAALWTAYQCGVEAAKKYTETAYFYSRAHEKPLREAALDAYRKREVIFLKIIAAEPVLSAWKSEKARELAAQYAREAEAYADPSKSLNARKLPKGALTQG